MTSPLVSLELFAIGPVIITRPVVTTWVIMAGLTLFCWQATRRLSLAHPGRVQAVL